VNGYPYNAKLNGPLKALPSGDLTDKEGRLVKLVNSSSKLAAALPTAVGDQATHVIMEAEYGDEHVDIQALSEFSEIPLWLVGACNPGDQLVNADPATAANAGAVRALPATAGTYQRVGFALEAGVDGQLVKVCPSARAVTV